jgi:dolichyl-phosphate beta-glucosyltransferase
VQRRAVLLFALAGGSYLCLAVGLWWHAWAAGASTHTLCGCGDPALFLWFFQWPATAVAHLQNPFYSAALFHPAGVNLLAQTSVMGISVPLIPVTWIFGPVASLNVAATLTPALAAFAAFAVLRRWVHWTPAAYVGGLLYGFSPFVLSSLEFAHLMTAAVMLLPLMAAALDEILLRQRHAAWKPGVLLGVLLFWQFFLSSELLAVAVAMVVVAVLVLVVAGGVGDRPRLRAALPGAVSGLVVAGAVGGVLLAYPVWFALEGPAHLSGLIWPNIEALGGFDWSSFVSANLPHGSTVFTALGGYEGAPLPSAGYLGWGLLAVLAAGLVVFVRDRRLWLFGFLLAFCVVFSLGERRGQLQPAHLLAHLPLLDQVIEQRFMVFGFLFAATMLALVVDHVHDVLPAWAEVPGAVGVAAVAIVPMVNVFAPTMPFAMRAVALPRWYAAVAPHLGPGRVLLSYPAPFSGIQVAMAWQAVDRDSYSQAGGGGPEGVRSRAGSAAAGFSLLSRLAFGVTAPQPSGTPAQLAAVRHALAVWRVNTVVVDPEATSTYVLEGHDPTYAAAFMTATLGRLPQIETGAWVWNDVAAARTSAVAIAPGRIAACVARDEKVVAPSRATLRVARCVLSEGAGAVT